LTQVTKQEFLIEEQCLTIGELRPRSYLNTVWPQIKRILPSKPKPIVILLEELTSADLAAVPDFIVFLKNGSHVLHWNEAGFWNKLRFFLPEAKPSASNPRATLGSLAASAAPGTPTLEPKYASSGWHYDGLPANISNNSSSTSTRGAIHQLLNIILQLRIIVLLLVSTLPYVVKVKNYS
jgi:hypothetical protein